MSTEIVRIPDPDSDDEYFVIDQDGPDGEYSAFYMEKRTAYSMSANDKVAEVVITDVTYAEALHAIAERFEDD